MDPQELRGDDDGDFAAAANRQEDLQRGEEEERRAAAAVDRRQLAHSPVPLGGYLLFYRRIQDGFCPHDVYAFMVRHKPSVGYYLSVSKAALERENPHLLEMADPVPFCIYPADDAYYNLRFMGEEMDQDRINELMITLSLHTLYRNPRCPYFFLGRLDGLIRSCVTSQRGWVYLRLEGNMDVNYRDAGWIIGGHVYRERGTRFRILDRHRCGWWQRRS